jgi:plasmid maintenance system antidote protein VapI
VLPTTTTITTLGAFSLALSNQANKLTLRPHHSLSQNNSNMNNLNKLFLSLVNADLLQMLIQSYLKSKNTNNNNSTTTTEATKLEAFLTAKCWNWYLFSEMCKIAREDFIEPIKFELTRLETQLEIARKKLESISKSKKDLTEKIDGAKDALTDRHLQSSSHNDNNNSSNTSNSTEDIQRNDRTITC